LAEHRASLVCDAVVAARRPRVRGHDTTGEEASGGQGAQHGIDRSFLEKGFPFIRPLQTLGDFVSVQVLRASLENRQQDEGDETGIQVFLEFTGLTIIH